MAREKRDGNPSALYRWALWSAARRRWVIVGWLLLVIALGAFVPRFLDVVQSVTYGIPGSESAQTQEAFGEHAGFEERDLLVVSVREGRADQARDALTKIGGVVATEDGVAGVSPDVGTGSSTGGISADGRTAFTTVLLATGVEDRQKLVEHLQEVIEREAPPGVSAALTGTSPVLADMIHVEETDLAKGEMLGIPVAIIVLFFACGSLVSAFIPVIIATLGLVACIGILGLTSYFTDWGAFIESVVAMLGLGLGIDYTLLIVKRFREERGRPGVTPEVAMARTVDTAGRTVAFSGLTVMVSLPSFFLLREPLFSQMAIAGMIVVALMIVLAIGLVPSVLLGLGDKLDKVPSRATRRRAATTAAGTPAAPETSRWGTWARSVMGRPWAFLVLALVVLGAAASPSLSAKLGVDYGVRALQDEPSGRALTQLQNAFPDATLAPVDVAITGGTAASRTDAALKARALLLGDPRIDVVDTVAVPDGEASLLVAAANLAVDDARSPALVDDLRERLGAVGTGGTQVRVGGTAAEARDYSQRMSDSAPKVIACTLLLSFLLLVWVFRSLVIPLKALLCNLLSVGAAYGLLVLVFQEGHGEALLGFDSPGYLQSWLPLTLFVFIFGLSMDYEVFLVTRMREEWLATGDNVTAVAHGLDRTGSVVSSAATIMVAVFAAFMVTATVPEIKQFAFGLGAAVLIDATIVRGMLVPAAMRLAGRWNWWLPARLDRLLPGTPSH
ncbi:Membrane protein YdfJ [Paraconexibacter sp. AEG42_29]|uniref:Membrane protein YdfJ n=1 Tax=Paraconexibacter sp. AEG42_29 TaxID=2997339 RepID=A0AAU7B1P0_9ACTN